MAVIKETLVLEDKFSVTLGDYVKRMSQAGGATKETTAAARAAKQQAQVLTQALRVQTAAARGQEQQMRTAAAASRLAASQSREQAAALKTQTAAIQQEVAASRLAASQSNANTAAIRQETAVIRQQTAALRLQVLQERQAQQQERLHQASVTGLTGRLKGLVGAYAGLQGVKALVGLSDTVTQTTARLDLMNDGLQTTAELNDMIYASAQRARGSYTETANMVAKLGILAGDAFGSSAEIVAFVEQLNKQMAISGTNTVEAQAAMLQLTQGLSSGVLRGEELNSVMEQTPMIAQTIADYLGVSTGEMRELASEGLVTADVVKNAMFAAAEETNQKFEEMPLTWGQVWTKMKNFATKALKPVLTAINWLANNLNVIAPLVLGIAAAFAVYQIAANGAKAATKAWAAVQAAFNAILALNPIGLVIMLIVLLIAVLVVLWEKCEGFRNFIVDSITDQALAFWGFYNDTLVPFVNGWLDMQQDLADALTNFVVGAINLFADLALAVVENFGFIADKVKALMNVYNKVAAAVGLQTIDLDYAFSPEGIEATRSKLVAAARGAIGNLIPAQNGKRLQPKDMSQIQQNAGYWSDFAKNFTMEDLAALITGKAGDAMGDLQQFIDEAAGSGGTTSALEGISSQLGGISDDVGSIEKSVSLAEEDIADMVDMATRRYVNKINLTAQTPVITINGANTGNTAADRKALADTIRDVILEQAAAASYRSTARVY